MKKSIRILSAVLGALLCLALLIGCAGDKEDTAGSDVTTPAAPADTTTAPNDGSAGTTAPVTNDSGNETTAPVNVQDASGDDCGKDIF